MFDSSKLYKMFKPDSNPDLITTYQVAIMGTNYTPNLAIGVITIQTKNVRSATSQNKDLLNPDELNSTEKGTSKIEITYQVDIYKKNPDNVNYIEVEREAIKVKEWLKSFEIQEYLQALESEILTNYSNIRLFPNEEINKQFINRAGFDFTIVTNSQISESIDIIENIVLDETIIIGDKNE